MQNADSIRNALIERLLAISDKEFLAALLKVIEQGIKPSDKLSFTEEQITMLQCSEEDIKYNRLTDQQSLDEEDLKWLRGK